MSDTDLADELRGTTYRLARRLTATSEPDALPHTHRAILATLDLDDGLTSADIARRERITPQAANLAVNTLARDGLLERHTDPADRRRRTLRLTPAGRDTIRAVRAEKNAWLDARLDELTDDERATLRDALALLARLADTP